jgi:outer membrane protein OmpA-like peptidoglycan-associated protein
MKRTIFFNILLVFVLLPGMVSAQFMLEKRADSMFDNLLYSKASSVYESLYKRDPQNGKYIQRLAYCYDKMLNYKKALLYYSYLVQIDERQPIDYYQYAQLLRIEGRIEDARQWLGKYVQLVPDDKRAINQYHQLVEFIALKERIGNIEIREVKGNTHFTDMCPSFYNDKLVFSSSRDSFSMVRNEFKWNGQPFLKLYVSDVHADLNRSSKFSRRLDTRVHEGPVCFSSDNNTIYYTSNSTTLGRNIRSSRRINNLKIFISTYDGSAWSEPQNFIYNSDEYSVGHPALSPDNKTLYFISDMPGGLGKTDLYKSELVMGQWSKPENLGPSINTEGKEMFPYVDKDGTLFFSSDGRPGMGCLDIYAASADENGNYMVVSFGAPLNSNYDDFGLIVKSDSLSGYFTSNRPGGAGDDDIYSFAVKEIDLKVTSRKESNHQILPNTKIYLKGEDGQIITSTMTDQQGLAEFSVKPRGQFVITAENDTYVSDMKPVNVSGRLLGLEQKEEVLLRQSFPFLTIKVIAQESGMVIPTAIVEVAKGNYDESVLDNGIGLTRFKMDNSTDYTFNITAEGYLSSQINYSSQGLKPGDYSLTVELQRLTEGMHFALENIYYDLNKSNIREDAMPILDNLALMLLENPDINIEIGSHTDCRADSTYNMELSKRRSESVTSYLIRKGVSPDRLVAKGFGETQLVNQCADGVNCPEEAHQANRRTVIAVREIKEPENIHITSL